MCADFDGEMADAVHDNAGLGLLETELEVEFEVLTQLARSAGGFLCCVHRL